ncbi:MAG: hypothetical protein NTZ78_13095 [Candidatus Aureabacteria bacterium]|nr:hypothetical protein [Candidatus Auribacterota bacterium]
MIAVAFIPWLLFWILICFHKLEAGSLAGLITTVVLILLDIAKHRTIKILQIGTVIFFFLLALSIPLFGSRAVGRWIDLMGGAALALTVLSSILIKKPFTLQYARETAPRERWNNPIFLHKNLVLSWVWFGVFIFNLSVPVANRIYPGLPMILNWVVSLCTFAIAMKFTHWYARYGGPQR